MWKHCLQLTAGFYSKPVWWGLADTLQHWATILFIIPYGPLKWGGLWWWPRMKQRAIVRVRCRTEIKASRPAELELQDQLLGSHETFLLSAVRKALKRRDSPWSWPYFVRVSWGDKHTHTNTHTYCCGLGCVCEGKRARATGGSKVGTMFLAAASWPKSLWILLDVAVCTDSWFGQLTSFDGFNAAHITLSFWKAVLWKDISAHHGSFCSTGSSFQV